MLYHEENSFPRFAFIAFNCGLVDNVLLLIPYRA